MPSPRPIQLGLSLLPAAGSARAGHLVQAALLAIAAAGLGTSAYAGLRAQVRAQLGTVAPGAALAAYLAAQAGQPHCATAAAAWVAAVVNTGLPTGAARGPAVWAG